MRKFHRLISSLLLLTCTSFLTCPQYAHSSPQFQELPFADFNLTYDDVLRLLRDIEEERIDNLSEEELNRISRFVAYLAEIGIDPKNIDANVTLKNDIAALFHDQEYFYEFAQQGNSAYASTTLSALLNGKGDAMARLCKRKKDKKKDKKEKHKKDKKKKEEIKKDNHKHEDHEKHEHKKGFFSRIAHFVKKHKKAIIIGAVIVVAAAAVVVAVGAVSTAAAAKGATAVGAAVAPALAPSDKKNKTESSSSPPPDPTGIPPEMAGAVNDQIFVFQEKIGQNQFFDTADPMFGQQSVPVQENGRILGSLLAHDSFKALQDQIPYHPDQDPYFGQSQIDSKFSTDYMHLFTNPTHEINFNALPYQVRGGTALNYGYYDQAVCDFGKAIGENPTDPIPLVQRGIAHFGLGDYENSVRDFETFTHQTQIPNPFSIAEFNFNVTKGLVEGIYESGESNLLFFADFVKHPIQTSALLFEGITALVNLGWNGEWGLIADALIPEVRELVAQWGSLSDEQKEENGGFILGKYGADILLAKGLSTLLAQSPKLAQQVIAIGKKMGLAHDTLLLETAAGIRIPAKIAEIVREGQTMMVLGEDVGISAFEMGQLKKAGQLEGAINSGLEKLVSQSESEVLKNAISQNKHVKMVRDYLDKPAKEIQKGISSYEKLIAAHKDKIANPTKHIPHWDKLDPRQREALLNKKWPAEIRVYEEQKNALQAILTERLSYE
jgi:hypothetical protein